MPLRDLTVTPTAAPVPVEAPDSEQPHNDPSTALVGEAPAQQPAVVAPAAPVLAPLTPQDEAVIDALKARLFDLNASEVIISAESLSSDIAYRTFLVAGSRYYEASAEIAVEDEAQMRRILNHFILPHISNGALDGSSIDLVTVGTFFLKEGKEERLARVEVFLPPVTPRVSVRWQMTSKHEMDLGEIMERGSVDHNLAYFLKYAVQAGASIVFSGAMGAGKSTLMGACAQEIPNEDPNGEVVSDKEPEIVFVIQDWDEIRLDSLVFKSKFFSFEDAARALGMKERGDSSDMVEIMKLARGKRVVMGECRGPEMYDYAELSSILRGCMTTMHANGAARAVDNAVAFAALNPKARAVGINVVRERIALGIDLVVQVEVIDGRHVVTEVLELDGSLTPDGAPRTETLYLFNRATGGWDRVNALSEKPGGLRTRLAEAGLPDMHGDGRG